MKYTITLSTKELPGLYTLETLAKRPAATVSINDRELAVAVAKKLITTIEANDLVKHLPE
jgi:hypothetical protein